MRHLSKKWVFYNIFLLLLCINGRVFADFLRHFSDLFHIFHKKKKKEAKPKIFILWFGFFAI